MFLTTPFMIAIQLVSARIGRVTGKGLAANVMELAPRWLVLALGVSPGRGEHVQYRGRHRRDGESLSLVIGGLNHEHALIFACVSILLQVFVPYRRYSPVLEFLTLTLFAYVATAFTVNIPWSTALPGGNLAKADDQCGLLPDGGGGAGDHDKPLSVFLAGFTGSRGNESGQEPPSAAGTDPGGLTELTASSSIRPSE